MSAKQPLTMDDVEHALELSSQDPDAPHDQHTLGVLMYAAVAGATTGLLFGGVHAAGTMAGTMTPWGSSAPTTALELGSDSHADFVH